MAFADPAMMLAAAPLAGLAVDFVALIVLRQAFASLNYLLAIVLAFAAGFCAQAALTVFALHGAAAPADSFAYLLLNILAYGALGYGYFTFVNLSATSLRIRIMRLILNSPGGRASADAIASLYDAKEMVDARLGRLVSWRQLRVDGARYVVADGAVFPDLYRLVALLRIAVYGRKS